MLSLVQPGSEEADDPLIREAKAELLAQAREMGMEAKSLQDLTRAERERLAAPYKDDQGTEDDEHQDEDFAGIISGEKDPAEHSAAALSRKDGETETEEDDAAEEKKEKPEEKQEPEQEDAADPASDAETQAESSGQ